MSTNPPRPRSAAEDGSGIAADSRVTFVRAMWKLELLTVLSDRNTRIPPSALPAKVVLEALGPKLTLVVKVVPSQKNV